MLAPIERLHVGSIERLHVAALLVRQVCRGEFLQLTDCNQICRDDFVCIHCIYLRKIITEISECIIFSAYDFLQ